MQMGSTVKFLKKKERKQQISKHQIWKIDFIFKMFQNQNLFIKLFLMC